MKALLVCLALIVGSIALISWITHDPQSDAAMVDRAKHQVRFNLKDPDSAQFRDLYVTRKNRADVDGPVPVEIAVCGMVNSRNSLGGMAGYTRFVSIFWAQPSGSISSINTSFEGPENRTGVPAAGTGEALQSLFETMHWNKHCVTEGRPETSTGLRS